MPCEVDKQISSVRNNQHKLRNIVITCFVITWVLMFGFSRCHAEELLVKTAAEYEVEQPPRPSQFYHAVTVETPPKFKCPANEYIILDEVPQHGEPFECGGHTFIIFGNAVYIKN